MTDNAINSSLPNAEQAEAWNGASGEYWVQTSAHHDKTLVPFGEDVLRAADLAPSHRVLDIGCGTGWLTRAAARAAHDGQTLGVDISAVMVDEARRQTAAEGPGNVAFLQADAQVHAFDGAGVDVVLSRFGVMFFDDPATAFTNIRKAIAPGGRLVFVCWQPLLANDWVLVPGAAVAEHVGFPEGAGDVPPPFALGDPDDVRTLLQGSGYSDVVIDESAHPMWLGADADDAFDYVRGQGMTRAMLDGKGPDSTARALAALHGVLEAAAGTDGVTFAGRAWLVTAAAA